MFAPGFAFAEGDAEEASVVEAAQEAQVDAGASATDVSTSSAEAALTAAASTSTTAASVQTTPRKMAQSAITQVFISKIGQRARVIANEHGLYPSVMIAQAILESASGTSKLSTSPNNNLFGIKGAYQGKSVTMQTQEDDGQGNMTTISAAFRVYPSAYESLEDYANLLTVDNAAAYASVTRAQAATYVDACNALQGKYATSSSYSVNLQSLILTYDLTRFDADDDFEYAQDYEMPQLDAGGNALTYAAGEAMYDAWGAALLDENGAAVLAAGGEAKTEIRTLDDLTLELTDWVGQNFTNSDAARAFTEARTTTSSSAFERTLAFVKSAVSKSIDGFDFAAYVYSQVFGEDFPTTYENQVQVGRSVDTQNDSLHVGDLLFFGQDGTASSVALYLDENYCVKVNQSGVVEISRYTDSNLVDVRRVVQTQPIGTRAAAAADFEAQMQAATERNGEAIGNVIRNLTEARMELDQLLDN